jgi:hypothetical protein
MRVGTEHKDKNLNLKFYSDSCVKLLDDQNIPGVELVYET